MNRENRIFNKTIDISYLNLTINENIYSWGIRGQSLSSGNSTSIPLFSRDGERVIYEFNVSFNPYEASYFTISPSFENDCGS